MGIIPIINLNEYKQPGVSSYTTGRKNTGMLQNTKALSLPVRSKQAEYTSVIWNFLCYLQKHHKSHSETHELIL